MHHTTNGTQINLQPTSVAAVGHNRGPQLDTIPSPAEVDALEVSSLATTLPASESAAAALLLFCIGGTLARRSLAEITPQRPSAPDPKRPKRVQALGIEPQGVGGHAMRGVIVQTAMAAAITRLMRSGLRGAYDVPLLHFVMVHSDNRHGRCAESMARILSALGLDPDSPDHRRMIERRVETLSATGVLNRAENTQGFPAIFWLPYDVSLITQTAFNVYQTVAPPRRTGRPSTRPTASKPPGSQIPPLAECPRFAEPSPFDKGPVAQSPQLPSASSSDTASEIKGREALPRPADAITPEQYACHHHLATCWNAKPGMQANEMNGPRREDSAATLRQAIDTRAAEHGSGATFIALADALSLCTETLAKRRENPTLNRWERFSGYFLKVLDAKIVDARRAVLDASHPTAERSAPSAPRGSGGSRGVSALTAASTGDAELDRVLASVPGKQLVARLGRETAITTIKVDLLSKEGRTDA